MDDELPPDDAFSTLVQTGKDALTFKEMQAFVSDIQARPTERLISDLPGLLALTPAKYQLVVMVLRKKAQPDGAEGSTLIERLTELEKSSGDATVRSRAASLLKKPGS